MSRQEILRAFKFALDPTPAQSEALSRHAGPCARGLVRLQRYELAGCGVRPVRAGVGPKVIVQLIRWYRAARARGGWSWWTPAVLHASACGPCARGLVPE